jgi:hypothetical protein
MIWSLQFAPKQPTATGKEPKGFYAKEACSINSGHIAAMFAAGITTHH